ncbi:hypothetical protein P20652_1355 [Pseudoalteromonas sp. BSi20652]|nr:hypothetical protein P20652_1355 [Pseudoalteromonas sp. BSi20652]
MEIFIYEAYLKQVAIYFTYNTILTIVFIPLVIADNISFATVLKRI